MLRGGCIVDRFKTKSHCRFIPLARDHCPSDRQGPSPQLPEETPLSAITVTKLELELELPKLKPGPAVVAFLDLECPACRQKFPEIQKQVHRTPGLQFTSVQFPLPQHKLAFNASVAAEIARASGKYDSVVADLLSGKVDLEVPSLNRYLRARSLPGIVGTPASKPYEKRVTASKKFSIDLGVNSTPTLLVRDSTGTWKLIRNAADIPSVGI